MTVIRIYIWLSKAQPQITKYHTCRHVLWIYIRDLCLTDVILVLLAHVHLSCWWAFSLLHFTARLTQLHTCLYPWVKVCCTRISELLRELLSPSSLWWGCRGAEKGCPDQGWHGDRCGVQYWTVLAERAHPGPAPWGIQKGVCQIWVDTTNSVVWCHYCPAYYVPSIGILIYPGTVVTWYKDGAINVVMSW